MSVQIKKAARGQAKLRIGISGPSGSGKTYSGLLMSRGLATDWSKVLLIDSENGSGELYSNLGSYNVITLTAPFSPEKYIEAIHAAEDAGMEVILIDSASHEWDGKGGCLEINENLASAKFKGNTWAAWSDTTPRHQNFITAIVSSSCHIVTTQRSKTDVIQTEDKKIKKVGMKDIQREGFEYELTTNFNIDREKHLAIASKDRTELFIDQDPFLISQKTGETLIEWNNAGVVKPQEETGSERRAAQAILSQKTKIMAQLKTLAIDTSSIESCTTWVKQLAILDLIPENYAEIINRFDIIIQERKQTPAPAAK